MKKFWRGFRKASDIREREDNAKKRAASLSRLSELIYGGGGFEDEQEFKEAVRSWKPGIKDSELEKFLKLFRNAVSGDPEHDQEPH